MLICRRVAAREGRVDRNKRGNKTISAITIVAAREGRVDRNGNKKPTSPVPSVAAREGRVDRNMAMDLPSLYGRVDRNDLLALQEVMHPASRPAGPRGSEQRRTHEQRGIARVAAWKGRVD
ncbi:hypothetical protein SAHY_09573 [Salinisphaera hydrothermalis EPR70]